MLTVSTSTDKKVPETASADALLAAAERLANVIAQENVALKAHDWNQVRQLAELKRASTSDYDHALKALGNHRALSLDVRERLQAAGERLAMLADENERRLARVMFAQRRVIAAISEAVIAVGDGTATYGRTGGLRRSRAGRTPPAVSVNCAL